MEECIHDTLYLNQCRVSKCFISLLYILQVFIFHTSHRYHLAKQDEPQFTHRRRGLYPFYLIIRTYCT
jgi:hypothetical protein